MLTCIDPDVVGEGVLAAYVSEPDAADQVIVAHVQQCSYCAMEVAMMRSLHLGLRKKLSRFDCPDTLSLTAFVEGGLPTAEIVAITTHLNTCESCANEVVLSRQFLAEPEMMLSWRAPTVAERVIDGLRRVVATLVERMSPPESAPVLQLRGELPIDDTEQIYQAEDVSLSLRAVRDDPALGGAMRLQGLIAVAAAPEAIAEPIPVRLMALGTETVIAEESAEFGIFALAPIPSGSYQIEITLDDRVIIISPLTL